MPTLRIGVLAGGESPEREISLLSGRRVHQALLDRGHAAVLLELDTLDSLVTAVEGIDLAFNCLHGGAGEDGTVHLLLDLLGIPYPGSGARAAFRAMDKPLARKRFATAGLAVPPGIEWQNQKLEDYCGAITSQLGFPCAVKPTHGGSSVGVAIADHPDKLVAAVRRVTAEFGSALVETYIPGRELTVGILRIQGEETPLPVIEIRSSHGFFDYTSKYVDGEAEFLVPAPLDAKTTISVQSAALDAHNALGCRGYSRVDLRLHEDGGPYLLEVNVLPGMTQSSDLPRAAAAAGYSFEDLVETMLATADKERQ